MLTQRQLAAKVAAQSRHVAAWSRKADDLARRKVGDAQAHALRALTATLVDTPDGRPTLAAVRRSPSLGAAHARLDELAAGLVDLIDAARRALYAESWGAWRAILPPEVLRRGDKPRPADIDRCARAVLHGKTPAGWVAGPIEAAARDLEAQLTRAASRANPAREAEGILRAWGQRTLRAVQANTHIAMNDSYGISDRMSGRDACKPDLLHPDPTLPA